MFNPKKLLDKNVVEAHRKILFYFFIFSFLKTKPKTSNTLFSSMTTTASTSSALPVTEIPSTTRFAAQVIFTVTQNNVKKTISTWKDSDGNVSALGNQLVKDWNSLLSQGITFIKKTFHEMKPSFRVKQQHFEEKEGFIRVYKVVKDTIAFTEQERENLKATLKKAQFIDIPKEEFEFQSLDSLFKKKTYCEIIETDYFKPHLTYRFDLDAWTLITSLRTYNDFEFNVPIVDNKPRYFGAIHTESLNNLQEFDFDSLLMCDLINEMEITMEDSLNEDPSGDIDDSNAILFNNPAALRDRLDKLSRAITREIEKAEKLKKEGESKPASKKKSVFNKFF